MASNVEAQVAKIFKHAREGSFGTRDKYKAICRDFARHCHEKFRLNNIRNVSDKHVVSYVREMQQLALDPKTIKTKVGAIRYMHDRIDRPRYRELSDNRQLQEKYDIRFEKVKAVNGNRAWTSQEYEKMQQISGQMAKSGRYEETAQNVSDCMTLARTMGLRVAEAACARRSQAEQALRTGVYHVGKEAKNGRPREVPLSPEARKVFERRMAVTDRGNRLFVKPGDQAHKVINRMEKFIERHREKVVTTTGIEKRVDLRDGSARELTFHGLRYNYVQQRMGEEISKGRIWEVAAEIVTQEIGHNRTQVLKIYEAGTDYFEDF